MSPLANASNPRWMRSTLACIRSSSSHAPVWLSRLLRLLRWDHRSGSRTHRDPHLQLGSLGLIGGTVSRRRIGGWSHDRVEVRWRSRRLPWERHGRLVWACAKRDWSQFAAGRGPRPRSWSTDPASRRATARARAGTTFRVLTRPDTFRVKMIYSRVSSPWAPIAGVRYVADLDEIWDDPRIDLVVVCTPSHSHAGYAKAVLARGKHVLVETPFAETAAEARELFALAAVRGLFLHGYQNRRFDSDFLTVQKVLASCVLGDLLELEMHYDYSVPRSRARSPRRSRWTTLPVRPRRAHHRPGAPLSGQPGSHALRRSPAARTRPDERLLRRRSLLRVGQGVGEVQLLPHQGPPELRRLRHPGDDHQGDQGPPRKST